MTTLHFALSIAAPLVTGVVAALWAGFVAKGMGDLPERRPSRDIRTW